MPKKAIKVTIVGNLAVGGSALNGQTVKTNNMYEVLRSEFSDGDVKMLETSVWRGSPLKTLWRCIVHASRSENIVIMPAQNGVKVFIPLFVLLGLVYRLNTHYVVIGAWLPSVLKKNSILRFFARRLTGVYAETSTLKLELGELGLDNVEILPNFKLIESISEALLPNYEDAPYRVCTFSRILAEKGIEDAIDAVIEINDKSGKIIYSLDIYGQVDDSYGNRFAELRKSFPDYVRYCGEVDPLGSVAILRQYYMLLFPTHYPTEGIPGTIIDAFAAGLPVVSAKWNSATDILTDMKTGILYPQNSEHGLRDALQRVLLLKDVHAMRLACLSAADEYTGRVAVQPLISSISGLDRE